MKGRRPTELKRAGFTLVEVIVTLMVAAVVGTMVFSVLGTSMTRSSEPIFRMKESFALQQVMENFLTAYYEDFEYYHMLPELRDLIAGGVTSPPGNEGATLSNSFGEYTIVENRYIKFDGTGNETGADESDPDKMLKVTIRNDINETLTYVFAP
jgi:prepilin-type N-terminal cleavage/methylation domain-containing protein